MELPENIKKLLLSKNIQDRAVGITILESLPEYEKLFSDSDLRQSKQLLIGNGDKPQHPTSRIKTGKSTYWVNTAYVYMWSEDYDCPWPNAEENIII